MQAQDGRTKIVVGALQALSAGACYGTKVTCVLGMLNAAVGLDRAYEGTITVITGEDQLSAIEAGLVNLADYDAAEAKVLRNDIETGVAIVTIGAGGAVMIYKGGQAIAQLRNLGDLNPRQPIILQAQRERIMSTPHGERPDPSEYLTQAEIDAHLALFDEGAVRFFIPHPSGNIGPEDAFVFPKSAIDDLYTRTGGDIRAVERELGLPSGYFDNAQVAVIDKPKVQMPSGNERGANDQWVPGGYTSGGIPEATLPGVISVNDVTVVSPQELFH